MVIDDTKEALTLSDNRIEKAVRQNHVRLVIIEPVHEIMKTDCDSRATCNQTRYNEEKRGGDIYGKNSKCICTC